MNSLVLWKLNVFVLLGVSGVGSDEVSVMEGDSVTLNTGVTTNQQEVIKWYFNNTRIAQISGDLSEICTDVQCNKGTEIFRDRLKLDHQTGSLTITNTHSGEYQLDIINSGNVSENIFSVSVHDRPATEREEVKEGESVTFDPGVINPSDSMMWYYNNIPIAEITGGQSKICEDDQCVERFRDRLKLDHPTGSLTITHIRNTDSGEYTLLINSNSSFSIRRKFQLLTVIGSGLSPGAVAGICAAVVLLAVAAAAVVAVIYYRKHHERRKRSRMQLNGLQVENDEISVNYTDKPPVTVGNGTSPNGNVAASET